jgi:drug/metabolite transporter (DMT)-like permease
MNGTVTATLRWKGAPDSPSRETGLRLGLAAAALGAIGFAAKGVVVKLAYQHGVDSSTVVALRMLFALPAFLLLVAWTIGNTPSLSARDWLEAAILGFFGGYLTGVLDFEGLKYVSAGLERLIVYLTPTIVLVIEVCAGRQGVGRMGLVGLGVSYFGVVLVLGGELWQPGRSTLWGASLVFASACTYAIYLVRSGLAVKRIGALRLTGLATSFAALFSLAHFTLLNPISSLIVAPEVLWLSLVNGVLCTFAPVVLVMLAIERLGAPLASQCGMIGPVATVALGSVFLGEQFTASIAAGTCLVLAGIWLLAKAKSRKVSTSVSGQANGHTTEVDNDAARTHRPK